jgi:hypothetical protein
MASTPKPSTNEIDSANLSMVPWSSLYDVNEDVPKLRFPQSVKTYDDMRHDPQIEALWAALTLPILRYRWYFDPNDASDESRSSWPTTSACRSRASDKAR